ncbi:MAG: protein-disulfide reductase DsbD domain-containing protein, partial [Planctomycetota bacterium]
MANAISADWMRPSRLGRRGVVCVAWWVWACLLTLLPVVDARGLASEPVESANVTLRLVSAADAAVPGETLRLGVLLEHAPTWHTYWTNPGDSGDITKLAWTLPEGVSAGEVAWPTPIEFEQFGLVGYGYEGELLLPVEIEVPADYAGESLPISVAVRFLSCAEVCIPGRASLSLEVPVAAAASPSDEAERFAGADASRPVGIDAEAQRAWSLGEGNAALAIAADALPEDFDASEARFLPADALTFTMAKDAVVSEGQDDAGRRWFTIELAADENASSLDDVRGIVAWGPNDARRSVLVDVAVDPEALALSAVDAASGGTGSASPLVSDASGGGRGLWLILASAFLGGMILNLMPCVFPVLALKISAFVGQAGESRGVVLQHGLAFGVGVLVSFWAIAAAVLAIKAGGQEIGWGFQLQNPVFVGAMAIVIFAIGLNFAGVFDIGVGVMNAAGKASGQVESKGGLVGSLGSGVLATALATPCSAPFLATSVGYAMTAPAGVLFAVLTAMGLGMALPYVMLSAFPSWLKLLPRPGAWMETFKQLMAFPMFAVAAWLVWVFDGQTQGPGAGIGLPGLLGGLVLVAMGLWALGRFGVPNRGTATRWFARVACLALVASS